MVQNFWKLLCILIYLYIQAQISAKFQVWFIAWRSQFNFLQLWEIIRKNSSRFRFLHQNPDCTSTNWFWYWPNLFFKLDFLRSCRLGFSHQRVNWELYNCKGGFRWEVFLLILALGFWCPRTHWRFCFESPRLSKSCFSLVDFCSLPSRSQSKKFNFGQKFRLKRCRFFPLQK